VAHTASRTVFSNWPTQSTPLNKPSAVVFSPHSGFMAIATQKGRTLLYRLHHFTMT
jgi:U3 small nucleolar RNA-associated protein 18